jgi:endonuclease IV
MSESSLSPEEIIGGSTLQNNIITNVGIHWDRSRITLDEMYNDCAKYGLTLKWIQIFTHGPRNKNNIMKPKIVELLKHKQEEYGLQIYVHLCYVCGLQNYDCIIDHLLTCDIIGGIGVIIHIPSNMSISLIKQHLRTLDNKANTMGVQCIIYLENAIYKEPDHIERLNNIMKYTKLLKLRYGLCIDTCHLQESGIDVNDNIHKISALKKYRLIFHLNDSNNDGRDYHQHLGNNIWKYKKESLIWILESKCPIILERSNIGYLPDIKYLNKINSNNNNNNL